MLLESAQINLNGLFLHADHEFDSQNLRLACAKRELEANMGVNSRSAIEQLSAWVYFDEELHTGMVK